MVIVMRQGATKREVGAVLAHIEDLGYRAHISQGVERTIIGVIGDERPLDPTAWEILEGVENVVRILKPYKLASREFHPDNTVITLNGVSIGGDEVVVMAGPCSVESREQIMDIAHAVRAAGATMLRGGAFKPRTSPYAFQGMGEAGLKLLREAADATGMLVVTEVMAPAEVPLVAQYADIFQIGTRNMQNYSLLHAVGEAHRPVLLKRGMSSTIEELLMAAEYILSHGNYRVMLCERGIRTFETFTRNTLDINAVPALKSLTHLPVIVDPSHATGNWQYVGPIAKAAVAAGADGVMIEVHNDPTHAMSDGPQSLTPDKFAALVGKLRAVAEAVERKI